MLTDYHMHLVDDDDPYTDAVFELSRIEAYVDAARTAGIDEIGFTDHVYRFRQARDWDDHPLWVEGAQADLDRYHACLVAARTAGLPVKVGLEVDYLAGEFGGGLHDETQTLRRPRRRLGSSGLDAAQSRGRRRGCGASAAGWSPWAWCRFARRINAFRAG